MLAIQGAAKALRGIGDQLQAMPAADLRQARIVGRLAEQIDGDHRRGPQLALGLHRLDGRFQVGRIEVVGVRQDVDEHRRRAGPGDHLRGRGEGERGAEHGVAGADVPGHQRQGQGVGAVAAGEGVIGAAKQRQLFLEGANLRAHHIAAMRQHLLDRGVDARLDPVLLSREVDEGDHGAINCEAIGGRR
jgi:hypothetical protein